MASTPSSSSVPAGTTTSVAADEAFDLDAYLRHIGFLAEGDRGAADAPPAPTLETLRTIARLHPSVIPFENVNALVRWPVKLDIASLQQKIVQGGRGGWCFEHNTLLMHALRAIGFTVTGLGARVVWSTTEEAITPRTHMVLRVELEDGPRLVDVGFGGMTMTGPITFDLDIAQETPHELYRLKRKNDEYYLQARLPDDWKTLYRFTLQPQFPIDYEIANWYICTHPNSHFLQGLTAARTAPDRRRVLRNNQWAEHFLDGRTERRTLTTAADVRAALEGPLGLRLPSHNPELEAMLERAAAFTPITPPSSTP